MPASCDRIPNNDFAVFNFSYLLFVQKIFYLFNADIPFVRHKLLWIHGQGTGNRHALAYPAGQLGGVFVQAGCIQPHVYAAARLLPTEYPDHQWGRPE